MVVTEAPLRLVAPVSLLVSRLDKAWLLSPTAPLKVISPTSVSPLVSLGIISLALTVRELLDSATERTVELKVISLAATVRSRPISNASL